MSGPLADVKVIELIEKGPGAHVTMVLADMGADVIKIESPSRGRESGSGGSESAGNARAQAANVANRGKRSIVLNLKSAEGRQIIGRLAEKVDVVVEGFRPGVTARLGADYETLRASNPRLIYCSLSGYGQTGPYRDMPGHDINYIAMAGILDLVGTRDGPPIVPPNLIADFGGAALHAICGIMMALYARERTGRGQHVDISYLDSAVSLLGATRPIRQFLAEGKVAQRGVGALAGEFGYYRVYETQDRRFISIGCIEPWLWENLCRAIDRPDLIDGGPRAVDFHGDESARQIECRIELEAIFKTRSRDAWFDLLGKSNVCVGKVHDVSEIFSDPHLNHRGMIPRLRHPILGEVPQIGIPIKLSDTPGAVGGFAPWKGQHADEILSTLGYEESCIARLRLAGVI